MGTITVRNLSTLRDAIACRIAAEAIAAVKNYSGADVWEAYQAKMYEDYYVRISVRIRPEFRTVVTIRDAEE